MTEYIYIETDHHANNAWGLLRPGTVVEGITPAGDLYEKEFPLNPEQEFLWSVREQAVENVKEIVGDTPVTYLHLGDYIQGWKHATDVVTDSAYEELQLAQSNMSWLAQELNLKRVSLVYGTAAHDGIRHESVKSLRTMLSGYAPEVDITWHSLLEVEGSLIDYAHHGPGVGLRDWLTGNQMRYYMKSLMSEELKRGQTPPRVLLRGHHHHYHWETIRERIGGDWVTMDYILVPSLCGMGAYARQVTKSDPRITNGSVLLKIDGPEFHVYDFIVERDLRKKELI